MLRRSVSMLVMLGYLAGQLAAVPHAHGGALRHEQHSAQPHIHVAAVGNSSHRHDHCHEHGPGHTHCHATPADDRPTSLGAWNTYGAVDHEADAVYLPSSVSPSAANGADQSKSLATPVFLHFVSGAGLYDAATSHPLSSLRMTGERPPGCDFCLTLRALRI